METIIKSVDHDYSETKKIISELQDKYGYMSTEVIGHSAGGRDIIALRIGRSNEYSLFVGAVHGSEHITSDLLLRFAEELCYSLQNDTSLAGLNTRKAMCGRGIIIVPLVNPDGVEISIHGASVGGYLSHKVAQICKGDYKHWNANLRGVDINHNFDAGWQELIKLEKELGIDGPAMSKFGGYRPFSEPETLALTELCQNTRIRHVVAFHSQGEVIYWNYKNKKPPHAEKMAEIMATSSGYLLDVPTGTAVGGGFKDWFIDQFNRPGFTVEVGLGQNPLPPDSIDALYDRLREMMMLAAIM